MQNLIALFKLFGKKTDIAFVYLTGFRRLIFSYQFLFKTSLKMAQFLAAKGVKKGDKVAIWAPNSPWWAVCFWGIILKGAVVVPIDFVSGKERAKNISKLSGCKFIIQSQYKLEKIEKINSVFIEDLEFILSKFQSTKTFPKIKSNDLVELVFTSGTTGNPKGVMLTHKNLMTNIKQVDEYVPINSDYQVLSLLPLSHMFEQTIGFLIPLYKGASIVYLRTLKPSAMIEALKKENVYVIVAVPRLLQALKNSIEKELENKNLLNLFEIIRILLKPLPKDIKRIIFYPIHQKFGSQFKFFVSGGAALDVALFKFWDELGFTLLEGYGLTECSPVLTANSLGKQISGSVGKALDGILLKIDQGQILAKGDNVFKGYWHNQKATIEAFSKDGYFKTGDIGELNDEGNLYIKGREKDVIVTSEGINVYPDEIESVLNKTPGVKESCVIGLDQGEGEQVHAVLILEKGFKAEEVINRANIHLDAQQQITGFTIWPEAEFPKTTTLKIQKFRVLQKIKDGSTYDQQSSDKLLNLISYVTGKSIKEIKENSNFGVDLGLTSIARLELVNYIEQEFRVDLEDDVFDKNTTVSTLRQIIEKKEKKIFPNRLKYWVNTDIGRSLREFLDTILHYPAFKIFFKLKTKGLENVTFLKEPVIFIANHRSFLDQPPIMFSLPKKIRYTTATLTREEFFFEEKSNFFRRLRKRLMFEYATFGGNLFPFPQYSGFRRYLKYMGELIDQGINILIFPEGERSRNTKLLPFIPGLGIMVKELKVPVVPVKIEGMEKIFPRGAKFLKRGECRVIFGKPIYFTTETPSQIVQISRKALSRLH